MKRLALVAAVLAVAACKPKDAATTDTATPAAAAPAPVAVDTTVKPDSAAVGASTGATTSAKTDTAKH